MEPGGRDGSGWNVGVGGMRLQMLNLGISVLS